MKFIELHRINERRIARTEGELIDCFLIIIFFKVTVGGILLSDREKRPLNFRA